MKTYKTHFNITHFTVPYFLNWLNGKWIVYKHKTYTDSLAPFTSIDKPTPSTLKFPFTVTATFSEAAGSVIMY